MSLWSFDAFVFHSLCSKQSIFPVYSLSPSLTFSLSIFVYYKNQLNWGSRKKTHTQERWSRIAKWWWNIEQINKQIATIGNNSYLSKMNSKPPSNQTWDSIMSKKLSFNWTFIWLIINCNISLVNYCFSYLMQHDSDQIALHL